jgi:hypothetical protein
VIARQTKLRPDLLASIAIRGILLLRVEFAPSDKEQDQSASTSSIGSDDLLLVAKVTDATHVRIFDSPRETG